MEMVASHITTPTAKDSPFPTPPGLTLPEGRLIRTRSCRNQSLEKEHLIQKAEQKTDDKVQDDKEGVKEFGFKENQGSANDCLTTSGSESDIGQENKKLNV